VRRALALAALLHGCDNGCRGPSPEPVAAPPAPAPPRVVSARCAAEVAAASVVSPPGTGDIDALTAGCDGTTLGVFVLRGHVLSWTARSLATGAAFARPTVVSTGADRLGPTGSDAPEGPVAWRSPIAGLDEPERDDVWAARVLRGDGGARISRGDTVLPEGVAGLGVPFAIASPAGLRVRAAVAREGVAPSTVSLDLAMGRDAPTLLAALPTATTGQIEAWESAGEISLARVDEGTARFLEARGRDGRVARWAVPAPEVVVVPRGVRTARGAAFLVGEFALGEGDAGGCVGAPGGACVRPGAVSVLVFENGSLRAVPVAPRGVPDALAAEGDAVTALYVEPAAAEGGEQRAARVDLRSGARTELMLAPPAGFPPIDSPQLARCGGELWLVAAVSLRDGAGVTALPLSCLR
jgi:hypothetical protein